MDAEEATEIDVLNAHRLAVRADIEVEHREGLPPGLEQFVAPRLEALVTNHDVVAAYAAEREGDG